jgi:hypothetical protein
MPRQISQVLRGPDRATAGGGVVDRLTTGQLVSLLRAEGWHLTPRIVTHAESIGALPQPARVGRYRQWRDVHVAALREYLRNHSRSQRSSITGEGTR